MKDCIEQILLTLCQPLQPFAVFRWNGVPAKGDVISLVKVDPLEKQMFTILNVNNYLKI